MQGNQKRKYIYLMPLSQLILLAVPIAHFLGVRSTTVLWMLGIGACICVAVNILLFHIIRKMVMEVRETVERLHLPEQLQLQKQYAGQIEQQESALAEIKKEITDHLQALIIADCEGDAMESYVNSLSERLDLNTKFLFCENPILDALLASRRAEAERCGIEFQCEVTWPRESCISNVTAICIFSNLLDNAIKACIDLERPFISIRTAQYLEYLIIRVINSSDPGDSPPPQQGSGLGLQILNDIAERYLGHFSAAQEGQYFRTEMTLRLPGQ